MKGSRSEHEAVEAVDAMGSVVASGLRYVSDREPGYRRVQTAKRFAYLSPDGTRVRDPAIVARISALAIPPAYRDVWICMDPNGHLQAVGWDARGRKQYRYHLRWRAVRDAAKFDRMLNFGCALPRIRRHVRMDLAEPGLTRRKVLATIVRLLETTLIRVGNVEYARDNGSYGLTTLRNKHVEIAGTTLHFEFRGKSGVVHSVTVSDPRVARIVRQCRELPGQELFQYLDADGKRHSVGSDDVNDYLHEVSGGDFTAKDYRTWYGTALALKLLHQHAFDSEREAKHHITTVLTAVAARLGNTPSICRKCYVHPQVIERYMARSLIVEGANAARRVSYQRALIAFLTELGKQSADAASKRSKRYKKTDTPDPVASHLPEPRRATGLHS